MNTVRRSRWLRPRTLLLLVIAALFLLPIYVALDNALKSPAEAQLATMWNLPKHLSAGGFPVAWDRLSANVLVSIIVVIPATVLSCLIGAVNGLVLSKYRFPRSEFIFGFLILAMFVPYQVLLIPLVQTLRTLHLYGTLPGLILAHIIYGIPVTTLIFRNYYAAIPDEIMNAASIDGAGFFRTLWHIIIPLSGPGFAVAAVFQVTGIWNDFLLGLVIVSDPSSQPITVALNNLAGTFSVSWNQVMAGAVLAALPTAIVYLALGKLFVRGLTAGSVK